MLDTEYTVEIKKILNELYNKIEDTLIYKLEKEQIDRE